MMQIQPQRLFNAPNFDFGGNRSATPLPGAADSSTGGPGGIGGLVNGLFETVFGQDGTNRGQNGAALSQMGDFDVDSFVESTLAEARGDQSGGLAEAIGSLMRLLPMMGL